MASALNDYERRRLDNIKRNDQMMSFLKLHERVKQLSDASKRPRIILQKKPKTKTPTATRRSLRTQGLRPDGSVASALKEDDFTNSSSSPDPDPPNQTKDLLKMQEAYLGDDGSDRQLIDTITEMVDKIKSSDTKNGADFDFLDLESFDLSPDHVMRVVPGGILSMVFFPFEERTVIVAGDKRGNVGFWDVDCEKGKDDSVYLYHSHSGPVSGILVRPSCLSKIFTSSYDGFIRVMDFERETFNRVFSSDGSIFSLSQRRNDEKSLYFGVNQGELKVWDEKAGDIASTYLLHDQSINCVDFNTENTNLMATSSRDGTVCIWDLRIIRAHRTRTGGCRSNSLVKIKHKKEVNSAYFSPAGSCLATTSLDGNVGLLSGLNFEDVTMISHDNRCSRDLFSLRAIWGWNDLYLFIGNRNRAVDVISLASNTMLFLESPLITKVPFRLAVHPFKVGTLAGATGIGQVYLWTKR